jgi:ABC-type Fe3+/spermidine/putrescine transport system ATPase subunit
MVFQDYALFPHLTIADNIGFGLRERGIARTKIAARVAELLDLIRLPQIARRYPAEISGGQAQRVALARAIAFPPRVLLMDEPLGALDLKLREAMQEEISRIQRTLRITTVYVTHDQNEAMNLSDTIVVMDQGRVIQRGTAREVYDRPSTRFVADFVGQINFLDGAPAGRDGAWETMRRGDLRLRLPQHQTARTGDFTLAIRPQHLSIIAGAEAPPEYNRLSGTVVGQSFSGNLCHFKIAVAGTEWAVEARPGEHDIVDGGSVTVAWHPDRAVVLAE